MSINLKTLIGKLNDTCRQAAERAASLCMARGNYEVDLEHLFLALLEQPGGDFALIARRSGIAIDALERDLNSEIGRFKSGNARRFRPVTKSVRPGCASRDRRTAHTSPPCASPP